MATHYDTLNVAPGSEDIVIRAAYRALMRKYHPDVYRGDPAHGRRMAQQINDAYAVLDDPRRRADYDASLRASPRSEAGRSDSPPSPPPTPPSHSAPPRPPHRPPRPVDATQGAIDARYGAVPGGFRYAWVAVLAPLLIFLVQEGRPGAAPGPVVASSEPVAVTSAPVGDGSSLGINGRSGDEATAPFGMSAADSSGVNQLAESPTQRTQTAVGDLSRDVEPDGVGSSDAAEGNVAGPSTFPDLSGIDREDRRTIELACVMERGNGPTVYNRCLRTHVRALPDNSHPDMSDLVSEDRRTVELACIMARGEGPAAYNRCLRTQLESLADNARPNLSGVHREDRRSIELACIMDRGKGPAAYHNCLRSQLSSLRQNEP